MNSFVAIVEHRSNRMFTIVAAMLLRRRAHNACVCLLYAPGLSAFSIDYTLFAIINFHNNKYVRAYITIVKILTRKDPIMFPEAC